MARWRVTGPGVAVATGTGVRRGRTDGRASGVAVGESTAGIRIAGASRGTEEGIELARTKRPALILMDIQLPGMDGIAALQHLKNDPECQRIPVIALTAQAMAHDRERILAAGFDGYHTKPIDVKELPNEVRNILDERGRSTSIP